MHKQNTGLLGGIYLYPDITYIVPPEPSSTRVPEIRQAVHSEYRYLNLGTKFSTCVLVVRNSENLGGDPITNSHRTKFSMKRTSIGTDGARSPRPKIYVVLICNL